MRGTPDPGVSYSIVVNGTIAVAPSPAVASALIASSRSAPCATLHEGPLAGTLGGRGAPVLAEIARIGVQCVRNRADPAGKGTLLSPTGSVNEVRCPTWAGRHPWHLVDRVCRRC